MHGKTLANSVVRHPIFGVGAGQRAAVFGVTDKNGCSLHLNHSRPSKTDSCSEEPVASLACQPASALEPANEWMHAGDRRVAVLVTAGACYQEEEGNPLQQRGWGSA